MRLLHSDFDDITKGDGSEYFYVYPIPAGAGRNLIIVSALNPTLALLEDSSVVILWVSLATLVVLLVVYLLLARFILSPFRKITEHAQQAGRIAGEDAGDADAIVADYQAVINEWRNNQLKLLQLNETARCPTGSLEQFNEYLLSSINSGIVTLNRMGRLLSINEAAGEILSVDPGEYVGRDYRDLFASNSEIHKRLTEVVVDGKASGYREFPYISPRGEQLILGVNVSAISDRDHNQVGVSILINDLTELNKLRSEIETRHRLAAMGEMAGGLAHQLRNSLGAVSGYGKLLRRKMVNAGLPVSTAESLLQEVSEAESLIRQFLDFTRQFSVTPVKTKVRDLIGEVVDAFSVRSEYRGIDFRIRPSADVAVDLDPVLFKQAVANIVDNAAGAYEDGNGIVEISSEVNATDLRLTVKDSGCGISPEDLDRVFTPFFSRKSSGSGLGLPLAAKIIDLHGGRIQLDSKLGQGTALTVILPLMTPVAARDRRIGLPA
jgi:PAS domain S-box-containing protein